jgi:hypothetical protein
VRPGEEERRCPACGRLLDEADVVCAGCDFDLVKNRQAVRVWPRVETHWETGPSAETRWQLFVGGAASVLGLAVLTALLSGSWVASLTPWFVGTPLLAFVAGTYYRCDLTRSPKGRVRLTRTWHVCFVRRPTTNLPLGNFDGLATGKVNEDKFWEWLLLILFIPGIITAVVWWYFAIHKDVFYVALTRDHGVPDEYVYRGWSEEKMRTVAATLREVAFVRCYAPRPGL